MALTEDDTNLHPHARPLPVLPLDALDRLARLHAECREASHLAGLLRNAIHAALLFMALGSCVLLLGGGTIGRNFLWAVSILGGVVGLILLGAIFFLPGASDDLFQAAVSITDLVGLPRDAIGAGYDAFTFWN